MVDFARAGGDAPRIMEGIRILEEIPAGQWFGPVALREHIRAQCDLTDKTVRNLIYDAVHCEKPILKKWGDRRSTRYIRAKDE